MNLRNFNISVPGTAAFLIGMLASGLAAGAQVTGDVPVDSTVELIATDSDVPAVQADTDWSGVRESEESFGPVSTVPVVGDAPGDSLGNAHPNSPAPTGEPKPETPSVDVDSASGVNFPRLTPEEYRYAGGPRYTLTGKLPFRETHLQLFPALITGGAVAGIITGIHLYQQGAWWADRRTGFHYAIDWGYASQADKFGHFFAGYFTSYVGYESLIASGFKPKAAAIIGPALAIGFQTYVEVEDGFSPFGFDPTDQVPNILGPALFSAQQFVPALQNFKFKWDYYPPPEPTDSGVYSGHNTIVIDDYNGQTIWLSLKLGNILPQSLGWPRWLRIAAGYGASGVDHWRRTDNGSEELLQPGRRAYISFDYDLPELIPDIGAFGNWIVQTLDYIHLPAPALQIVPDVKFLLLYPIRF